MTPIEGDSRLPLRLGTADAFQRVRTWLTGQGFTASTLCQALGLAGMDEIGRVDWVQKAGALTPTLAACVELFILGRVFGTAAWSGTFEPIQRELLELGLVKPLTRDPDRCFSPVWLYPVEEFLVASDRTENPDDEHYVLPEDVVFPAIYGGTLRFLKLLPDAQGGDALDLCGGAGIGAFHLARTARTAATSDLTPRAAHFAEFSARLNQLSVASLCGDLYQPVAGRQFDVITAHPPFVPAVGPTMVYRDAGETGEDVTRGIVAGLPAHLRPGGRCLILCVARDTVKEPFEERAHGWLGEQAGEFDVGFALEKTLTVDDIVNSFLKRGQVGAADGARLRERLLAASTRQFIYGALVVERRDGPCRLKPVRLRMEPAAGARDLERFMSVRRARNAAGFVPRLADARPALAPSLEIRARHVVRDGELVPAEFVFAMEGPLPAALRADGFVVPVIANLNGRRTVREVYEQFRQAGGLPAGFPLDALLELVARLIGLGLLLLPASDT